MLRPGTRWLMRVARLRSVEDASIPPFEDFLAARGLPHQRSRQSRWEYGHSDANPAVLRAYEDGTELPPFLLFALNDRLERATRGSYATKPSRNAGGQVSVDSVHDVLDRVVDSGAVTGSDWYQLASSATSWDFFYLSHHSMATLARRLILELAYAVGPAYVLRLEAMHLLVGTPRMSAAFHHELLELLADSSTIRVGDSISLFLRAPLPVREKIVAHLQHPKSAAVAQAKAWIVDTAAERRRAPEPTMNPNMLDAVTDQLVGVLPAWATAHIECDMVRPLLRQAIGTHTTADRHEASVLLMLTQVNVPLADQLLRLLEDGPELLLRRRLAELLQYQMPFSQFERLDRLIAAEHDDMTAQSLKHLRVSA